jgi:hypothetical protein
MRTGKGAAAGRLDVQGDKSLPDRYFTLMPPV